jgi:hypothetical protein
MSAGGMNAGVATAAAVTRRALRASGVIIHVEGDEFLNIVSREPRLLVVHAAVGLLWQSYRYLTSYRGLAFYTNSPAPLSLPKGVEVIMARSIWVP